LKVPKEFIPSKKAPKMWDKEEDSPKRKSLQNEKRLSKEVGFRLTPASGNMSIPAFKGDGQTKQFMFECKETETDKLTLGVKVFSKLCREAAAIGKDPALILSLYGFPDPIPKDWVVIPAEVFSYLVAVKDR